MRDGGFQRWWLLLGCGLAFASCADDGSASSSGSTGATTGTSTTPSGSNSATASTTAPTEADAASSADSGSATSVTDGETDTGETGTCEEPGDGCECELTDSCIDETPTTCGDGVCDPTDHCDTCPDDCGACSEAAPEVIRGPYLQSGAPTSLIIKWRTAAPSTSAVAYGQDPQNLQWVANSGEETTEHELTVSGLTPGARYYYAFGSADAPLLGGDEEHRFATSPTPGTAKPTRIWLIGDSGDPGTGQNAVRDAYIDYAGDRPANLWLMLGDNAYDDGTDSEFQDAVFDENAYQALLRNTMLWPTIGNHERVDVDGEDSPYFNIFALPTAAEAGGVASSTEYYYSFDYGIIHFVCLDSDTNEESETAMAWLRNDLEANDKPWLIAFWHHPPYTNGSHNSDDEGSLIDMRENFLPILEEYGVDMVFTGHSHSYERSVFLYGHYGSSDEIESNDALIVAKNGDGAPADGNPGGDGPYQKVEAAQCPDIGTPLAPGASCGTVYSVVGSSSKVSASDFPTRYDGGPRLPSMFTYQETLGSVVIDIDDDTADVVFLDSGPDNEPYRNFEVSDEYRIVK